MSGPDNECIGVLRWRVQDEQHVCGQVFAPLSPEVPVPIRVDIDENVKSLRRELRGILSKVRSLNEEILVHDLPDQTGHCHTMQARMAEGHMTMTRESWEALDIAMRGLDVRIVAEPLYPYHVAAHA